MQKFPKYIPIPKPCFDKQVWIVACSGGVDSVVLASALSSHLKNQPLELHYVDHNQRAAAKKDSALVKSLAKKINAKFVSHVTKLKKVASENEMRKERYKVLISSAKEKDAVIFTAHHAQDNLETWLYKICRGANPQTITGIEALTKKDGIMICRPLLNMNKSEILEYAMSEKLEWIEDITNLNTDYTRNKIRWKLLPLLNEIHSGATDHLQSFFSELKSMQTAKLESDAQTLKLLSENMPVEVKATEFLSLKSALDELMGEYSSRTTKAHWNNLKKILSQRYESKSGSGPQKMLQFPGGNCLVFKGNKLFWNPSKW